jgi:hypothetical protein
MTRRLTRTPPYIAEVLLSTALMLALTLSACGRADIDDAIIEYAGAEIVISGLTADEFTVTPAELAKLDSVSATGVGQSAKAGTVRGAGPTLATFLAQYGVTTEDVSLARFIASDGYRVTLREKSITGREVIMAITGDGGPLPQSERPMRLIIPEAESNQWIYAVERIEFEILNENEQ